MGQLIFSSALQNFTDVLSTGVFTQQDRECSIELAVNDITQLLKQAQHSGNRVFLIGNGGSAAVAGHICTDLINACKVTAQVLHDASQLTCFSNDFGYVEGYSSQLEIMAKQEDILIAISSSGKSDNIINAVTVAQTKNMKIVTLTGFGSNNPLRKMGDWNYWLDSSQYGQIEIGHLFLLHHLCDQMY
jgi:D-sedoheptulose 7-phosphate isomerase